MITSTGPPFPPCGHCLKTTSLARKNTAGLLTSFSVARYIHRVQIMGIYLPHRRKIDYTKHSLTEKEVFYTVDHSWDCFNNSWAAPFSMQLQPCYFKVEPCFTITNVPLTSN